MGFEIDFLPVGEESQSGDAILLRYGDLSGARERQTVVLVDGGFRETADAVIEHLGQYYQTNMIDLVVSTHPDADHISGLREIFDRVKEGTVVVSELWMHRPSRWRLTIERGLQSAATTDYARGVKGALDAASDLEDTADGLGIPISEPFAGLVHSSGHLRIVGPTEQFYRSLFAEGEAVARWEGRILELLRGARAVVTSIAEAWNIETLRDDGVTSPMNNSSAIVRLDWGDRTCLLTGDAGIPALESALDSLEGEGFSPEQLHFVQVPHHGSRRNVGPSVLDRLLGSRRPTDATVRSAFASVARKGAPKHPAKKVTNAFLRRGTAVHVTQGEAKRHFQDAPSRGWSPSQRLPFYETVEE